MRAAKMMTEQIDLPFDIDVIYNQVLTLPPPVRGLIFSHAKMKGEAFSSVKTLQRYVGAKPTGLADANTCSLVQDVLKSKGSIRVSREIVDLLLRDDAEDTLAKNLMQYRFQLKGNPNDGY